MVVYAITSEMLPAQQLNERTDGQTDEHIDGQTMLKLYFTTFSDFDFIETTHRCAYPYVH